MAFSEEKIQQVWGKGKIVANNSPDDFRKDVCGAWIARNQHGNRNSMYGWEIDHVTPQSKNGSDKISNLRPLHWENNLSKSNDILNCTTTANGKENVTK